MKQISMLKKDRGFSPRTFKVLKPCLIFDNIYGSHHCLSHTFSEEYRLWYQIFNEY